jgi:hypothetical protein
MSYIILRGHWCHIFLNIYAKTGDNIDDVKLSFCEELVHVFDEFSKYLMRILLEDVNVKVGREDVSNLAIGNESVNEINGVRVVNFAMSKNLTVKSKMFPHYNIHNYARPS